MTVTITTECSACFAGMATLVLKSWLGSGLLCSYTSMETNVAGDSNLIKLKVNG